MYEPEFIDEMLDYISSPEPPPQSLAQFAAHHHLTTLKDITNNSKEDSATIAFVFTKNFLEKNGIYSVENALKVQPVIQSAIEEIRAEAMNAANQELLEEYEYADEEDQDEWDEEEDEDTDEEEDYVDDPTIFAASPSAPASAPSQQEPERYQPAQGQSRLGKRLIKDPQTGEYKETGDYVDVPQASRRQGLYIIGATGTGKSGLKENLIVQDIKQGYGVCILDPHGDLINAVLSRMDRHEDDVILLDITDYHYPFGINLFSCSDPTNPLEVQKIVDQVFHVFEKLLGVSQETQLILEYLYNCTATLIANPGYTMADIPLLLQDEACRRKLVANVTDSDVIGFWKHHDQKKPNDQNNDIASTLRRVRRFLQPLSRNIVGQSASTIDLQRIMDEGKILLVKLSAQYQSVSNLIGSMLIALILNAMYARPANKRRQFNLYADEFQRFATDDFATLLTEARKFGIATTIAHQARFQPGMTDGIRATTLGATNLVVFRVQPEDATELAGRFDITPQEAWEEEIEPEWVEIVTPQRHERVEEQVEVEVEDDIDEISQKPIDYLVSMRGTHSSKEVRNITQRILIPMTDGIQNNRFSVQWTSQLQKAQQLLNNLLVSVMERGIDADTDEITTVVTAWPLYNQQKYMKRELIAKLVNEKNVSQEWRYAFIRKIIAEDINEYMNQYRKNLDECLDKGFTEYDYKYTYRGFFERQDLSEQERIERACTEERRQLPERWNYSTAPAAIQDRDKILEKAISFINDVITLCSELAAVPIRVPTGQKRMVKRIQPHITYLTHESEKITHPRVAIMHPQRSYADMLNEVASQIANLPVYTAKVKITVGEQEVEHTIKTLDPKQEPGKPLFRQALQERIARIQAHNRTPSLPGALPYCRSRQEVEAEIRTRQVQCSQPPPDEPPVSRRQQPKQ